jgi:hypothetical protein
VLSKDKALVLISTKTTLVVVAALFATPFTLLYLFWLFVYVGTFVIALTSDGKFFQNLHPIALPLTLIGGFSLSCLWWLLLNYIKLTIATIPNIVKIGLIIGTIGNLWFFFLEYPFNNTDLFDFVSRLSAVISLLIILFTISLIVPISTKTDSNNS